MARTLKQIDSALDELVTVVDEHIVESERNSNDLRKEMISFHSELTSEVRGLRDDIKPLIDVMTSGKIVDRIARYVFGGVFGVIALLLAIKQLGVWGFFKGIFFK